MLGFPETGKTTFLAAFYVATENGDGEVRITRYSEGDREHLNKMVEQLGECTEVDRTSEQEPKELRLSLAFSTGQKERLLVPDMSGELVERATTKRRIDEELGELTVESDSVLLFLRADEVLSAEPVQDLATLLQLVGLEIDPADASADATPDDWDIDLAPTQVRLVDVVQELKRLRKEAPLRLTLIVSAWDQTNGKLSPREWAVENLPLLVQLLDGLPEITWTVFGVSAQGGNFSNESDRKRLENTELIERPLVLDAAGAASSVFAPVCWALEV
jgi:Double-GTPase 1